MNSTEGGIGDEGASAIGEVLRTNTTLIELHIGGSIGNLGARRIFQAMEVNTTLTSLTLGSILL